MFVRFERRVLVYTIGKAKQKSNITIYKELLKILFRFLNQEQINGDFLIDLYYYESLSEETITFYDDIYQSLLVIRNKI